MTHQPPEKTLTVQLHGLKLGFQSADRPLLDRFKAVYGHLPPPEVVEPDILVRWTLHHQPAAPEPDPALPRLAGDALISHYGTEDCVVVRLPKYALVTVDLRASRLSGQITPHCLEAYGVFEDVMMITLAPLYRRRGWFPLHAFAGLSPGGEAALLIGQIGAGKTTTGLALLSAGWGLLSNDSPLLTVRNKRVHAMAYPGRLSAYDDSLTRFDHLQRFVPLHPGANAEAKRVFRAEEAFPDPWAERGEVGGVFFPKIRPGLRHSRLIPLAPGQALLQLMPQAIESWDKAALRETFRLLRQLVEQAPSYILELGPDVDRLPQVIAGGMRRA